MRATKKTSIVSNLAEENELLKKQIKSLEASIESLERTLHRSRSNVVNLRLGERRQRKSGSTFYRVVVPDSHGSLIDQDAANAFVADLELLQPDSIIMLGDHIDCGGFLAQHHTMGFVAETAYSFEDDVGCANQFLDAIQRAAPSAKIEYLEGNHEHRIQKWVNNATLRNPKDAAFIAKMYSTERFLYLEKRGIDLFCQGVMYDGLQIPATIKRDGCYFTHGEFTSKHAAMAHLAKFNANIWYGHTHRQDMATMKLVDGGIVSAWNPGCLCKLQPMWMHTNLTNWSHGYGLQLVQEGVGYKNLVIDIHQGVSTLAFLVDVGRKGKKARK